ncbi:hypothetical protein GCM10020256_62370 [Streptomyces thermocoprophilus]
MTVTHTLGVVALGVLVTAGSAAAPSVIAWLGVASGALVMLAGTTLLLRALRARGQGHSHGHGHHHDHGHPPHARTRTRARPQPRPPRLRPGRRPTAPPTTTTTRTPHVHSHGGIPHTHPRLPPTLRGTLLLGFAGGLVPSPSAVVVLVGAAALGHAWFGLLLVVAYGAGLALTLTAAGVAVVRLGSGTARLLQRRPRWTAHPLAGLARRVAPLGSASVVVALGAGLVLKGAASALG